MAVMTLQPVTHTFEEKVSKQGWLTCLKKIYLFGFILGLLQLKSVKQQMYQSLRLSMTTVL